MTAASSRPVASSRPATFEAEWALWGKESTDPDYRLLRCSSGTFSSTDFTFAIGRYSPGTLDIHHLPQVTVGWLKHPRTRAPSHLGFAIHETAAADDPRSGQARDRYDAVGRDITFIRYFCVPFDAISKSAVSYRALYEGFQRRALPAHGSEPIKAELAGYEGPAVSATERQFAVQVAAQLLTTRPVCILGAGQIELERRLGFIDLVMSSLPYGARCQLSASTWVNSNFTGHKLRLFFASTPRDEPGAAREAELLGLGGAGGRKPDVVVDWGNVHSAGATDKEAIEYLNWDGLSHSWATDVLALQVAPVDLKDKGSIRDMLQIIQLGTVDKLTLSQTLKRLGEDLRSGVDRSVPSYIDNLRNKSAGRVTEADRAECLALIRHYDLLGDAPGLGDRQDQFYDSLLRLTLDGPFSYEQYVRLQDLTSTPLQAHIPLLTALRRRRKAKVDASWLLVRKGLGYSDDQLMAELWRQSVTPEDLAGQLVADAVRIMTTDGSRPAGGRTSATLAAHGRLVIDLARVYLLKYGNRDRAGARRLGYLAPALAFYFPTDKPAQVQRLVSILRNIYGGALGKGEIREVLGKSDYRPTDALLAAVIELAPGHTEFAMTEYGRACVAPLVPMSGRRRWHGVRRPARRGVSAKEPAAQGSRSRRPTPQAIVLAVGLLVICVMIILAFVGFS